VAAVGFAASVVLLLLADLGYLVEFLFNAPPGKVAEFRGEVFSGEVGYELGLSLITATATTLVAMVVAVPAGYALSRHRIPAKVVVDTFVDAAIVLPPLIMGVSLLVLFTALRKTGEALGAAYDSNLTLFAAFGDFIVHWPYVSPGKVIHALYNYFVFQRPGIVLAQFFVATALAVRSMRAAFDAADRRVEAVALTLGCSRFGAFWRAALPQTWSGMLAGGVMAWSYSVGLFAPVAIFAGTVKGRTAVLPTRTYLEVSVGKLELALALTILMAVIAMGVLIALKFALRRTTQAGGGAP
jgi:molybdate transport system permease protein